MKLVQSLGAKRAVTTISAGNDTRPYHENFEFHRRRLAELGELLAPYDIKLGLQFTALADARKGHAFQFIHTLDALVTLVNMVRAPNVGVVADVFQIHAAGNSLEDLTKLGPGRLIAVDLSDAPADVEPAALTDADRLLPGETGKLDAAAALGIAADLGFDGPVTPLAHRSRMAGMRRDQIVKLAAERVDVAWKAANLAPSGKKLAPVKA